MALNLWPWTCGSEPRDPGPVALLLQVNLRERTRALALYKMQRAKRPLAHSIIHHVRVHNGGKLVYL